jgi:phosphate transport system protein
MGLLVRDMISLAEKSFSEIGTSFVEIAEATDKKVNNYDYEIETQALTILALRQPMAVDLRQVISAFKVAVILERMGDLSKNTTKRASMITTKMPDAISIKIKKMFQIIINMLELALEAFQNSDKAKALMVCEFDGEVDEIYALLMNKLQEEMVTDLKNIPSSMQIIFAIKNIERIGDYVTKFAKIIYYIVSGEGISLMRKS